MFAPTRRGEAGKLVSTTNRGHAEDEPSRGAAAMEPTADV
jgi:hypothetical protein